MRHGISVTAVMMLLTSTVASQSLQRCGYMVSIPREPKPDLPELDFAGTTWSDRPFLPAPDRDDVCMDQFIDAGRVQVILMEEEIEGDVAIAKLNYRGQDNTTPEIRMRMLSGSYSMLGPKVREENDEFYLYITERQDYETPGMQMYMFEVRIEGEPLIAIITLQIVNIDDNAPIVHVFDPCIVPELDEPGLTNCIYNVTDADGEISVIAMTFEIESDRNDDQIFHMQGSLISGEWKRMYMTVGLNRSLDYEMNALHIFRVTALDSLPNTHTVTMMVQVQNVEHRQPRWVEIFAVQQFDEKTYQRFNIRAIDGDTGIDKPIKYKLSTAEEDKKYFNIIQAEDGRSGAILQVYPIDRDKLQREVFPMTIEAYKYDNASFTTSSNVAIIIIDINDQIPEPLHDTYRIAIDEETPQTINFDKEFGFYDRDLGGHAQYKVHLESVYPPGAAAAFYIQPEVGYQKQTFIMGTTNHTMLDYEVEEFQHIELNVIATDLNNTNFIGVATVHIDLINWNDEVPKFEKNIYSVYIEETVGKGYVVDAVKATDRDIGDRVEHALLGNAQEFLRIDKDTGLVTVSVDEAFDYHRQNELLVQIRAVDTLGEPFNTATSQLVINLIDINNTPPTLRLPRGSPRVEENVPEGYQIIQESGQIEATDPDTSADLRFEIIWETSYATKQGRETDQAEYHGCLEIETIYPEPEKRGSAIGMLTVKEIRDNVTIDYEEFEVLYLTVRVVDANTAIGRDYDELTFTITIIDMNDNAPVWAAGTVDQKFRVRENSAANTVIGTVQATDIDGPLYNQIRYTLIPINDTPKNLIKIDFRSGQIEVDLNGAIDADEPRYNLYYTVIASDECSETNPDNCPADPTYWETKEKIKIQIIDTNNKVPVERTDKFNVTVWIYENATTGDAVETLVASDQDRDEMYHTVSYQINYAVNPRLRDFFSVNLSTGLVYVDYTGDDVLDRDGDEPRHQLFFNLIDNLYAEGDGNRNQNTSEILVILLDVNDNAPELPPRDQLYWSISEDKQQGYRLLPYIYAPDRDEPDTDNSRVGYQILSLTLTNRDIEVPTLFNMIQIENVTGELETAMDLRGYWGTYDIHILAYDHGVEPMSSNETYELVIRPYNYHAPVFIFPQNELLIRLSRERAVPNGLLVKVNGEFLESIKAIDEDGLDAGIVTFSIVGNDAQEHFHIDNNVENQGILMLKQMFTENTREFRITISARDGGIEPQSLSTEITLRLIFVPTQGEPEFTVQTTEVNFVEKEIGLTERRQLPLATDPKNYECDSDCRDIYYRIVGGNDGGFFAVDPIENVLYVVRELDRSADEFHTLRVAASNIKDPIVTLESSTLIVVVTVREANPRPYFVLPLYTAGISTSDNINRELLTVQATHSEGAAISYTLDQSSMVEDPSLSHVRDTAFSLNKETGLLTLTFQPTPFMQGMFQFNIIATDSGGERDQVEVRVYLISSLNRVYFRFVNAVDRVVADSNFIAQTFSTGFTMTCNIDQVVQASDESGAALEDVTEVRAHFIKDDLPVETATIEKLRSDKELLNSIQRTLNTRLLVLIDFVTGETPTISSDRRLLTVYILAGVALLFGLLFLVMLVVFILRTRALNRRLDALSMTKYGSQDSGLNRAGLMAPGTNKHAVEGSNPIWNEAIKAPDFDAISDTSDDSDLIGIENLPQFRVDHYPSDDTTPHQDKEVEAEIAHHSNNFGFNPTLSAPKFANSSET